MTTPTPTHAHLCGFAALRDTCCGVAALRKRPVLKITLAAVMVLTLLGAGTALASPPVPVPRGAKLLEDGRYSYPGTYSDAVAHFRKTLKRLGTPFEATRRRHTAAVKYTHFRSLEKNEKWSDINIAFYEEGVYIRFLFRGEKPWRK